MLKIEVSYELIRSQNGIPINAFIHSVKQSNLHWHHQIEIILVLKGSINLRIESELYLLEENDLILINSNSAHNTSRTMKDNIILALQIDPDYYSQYYSELNKIVFNCKSFGYIKENQEKFDVIRHYLARIVWELNKKQEGFKLKVGSEVNLLLAYLVNNFKDYIVDDENIENLHQDMDRIQNILSYINDNIENKITLQEIAHREHLNVYYLSHFIKKILGISFQEYLNIIRLDKAVALLLSTNKTITDISYESGFPSTKSLNRLFKKQYNCSPSHYRKGYEKDDTLSYQKDINLYKSKSRTYLDVDRNAALKKLFSYLSPLRDNLEYDHIQSNIEQSLVIDAKSEGIYYKAYWKKLTTFGRAAEGLRKNWQEQFKELQKDIGFEYVRFHGIFSDEMMIINMDREGVVTYNWNYVDELFDFFKEQNIKPFIELGFMPHEFKSSEETVFWWKANVSQPREISLWTDLVKQFINHCINRYGKEEVETWYFEVWNEPDLQYVFWIGTKEEYFEFYKQTVLSIKSISSKLKVGGPSSTYQHINDEGWLEEFLIYCNDNIIPLDFVSIHIYPENYLSKEQIKDIASKIRKDNDLIKIHEEMEKLKRIYFSEDNTYQVLESANELREKLIKHKIELHVTEWNASAYNGNLIHDTCYISAFIIKNVLQSIGLSDSLGYWTFTDLMEEGKAKNSPFHGGFGLINNCGLKKPSYLAYYLLSKLGEKIIQQGEEYIVTKDKENIQVLAYNFVYFDELFLNGDTSSLTNKERYLIYNNKPTKAIEINIEGLSGSYKITKYQLNREYGSTYDEWIRMGSPEELTKEEINYLKGKSYPKIHVEYLDIEEGYKTNFHIPIHGVELVTIEKVYIY